MKSTLVCCVAAAVTAAATLTGCAFDPSVVAMPGTGVSGPTYPVRIEFANTLNLPSRAKVLANGVQVGNLESVALVDPTADHAGYVVAHVNIKESVRLPTTTSAQLRQATVLGDVYIGLTTPPEGFGTDLASGGTIGMAQTQPAMQLEDAMSGLAVFFQGGAVGQAQDIVNRINASLPSDPAETARISSSLGANITDLAANLDHVESLLHGLQLNTQVVLDKRPELTQLLTDEGVQQTVDSVSSIVAELGLFGVLGQLAHALEWVAPLVTAGDAAAKAFVPLLFTSRPLDLSAPSNMNLLVRLVDSTLIPFVTQGPKVNVTSIEMSESDRMEQIIAQLRMIGAVR